MNNLVDPTPRIIGQFNLHPIALGCWRLVAMSSTEAQTRLEAAIESGINLIDNADVYGLDWGGEAFGAAEELLGKVLSQAPHIREKIVLATKGGIIPGIPYDSANLEQACNDSLKRLQVEQIDLYQIHRPDLLSHPADVARILEKLRSSGKICEVGVSNFSTSQIDALQAHLSFKLVSSQPEYSALHLSPLFDGTFDHAMQHNLAILAWSPLAGGRLSNTKDLNQELAAALNALAQRESVDVATIALSFVLAHPTRPIGIIGTTNVERIKAINNALEVTLDKSDVYQIIQASMGASLP